jgi:hypothetical protein
VAIDIDGWIEVCRLQGVECPEEYAWSGVVRLGALIDCTDDVSEHLFGFSKRAIGGGEFVSVAASRGLPSNVSEPVVRDLERIRSHEAEFGPGECRGYTFATWSEIQNARITPEQLSSSDWGRVFELVRSLGRCWNIPDHQIRFVVWYVW